MVRPLVMEAMLFFSIMAAVIGAIIAWFHSRELWNLCVKTAIVAFIFFATALLILDGPPKHYTPRYLLHGVVYIVYPYVIFILIPSVVTAVITFCIRRKLRR